MQTLTQNQIKRLELIRNSIITIHDSPEFAKMDYYPDMTLGDAVQAIEELIIECQGNEPALWYEVAHLYMNSDEDMDCPQAQRAYDRAMSQRNLADFLDPETSYNFYTKYRNERNNCVD